MFIVRNGSLSKLASVMYYINSSNSLVFILYCFPYTRIYLKYLCKQEKVIILRMINCCELYISMISFSLTKQLSAFVSRSGNPTQTEQLKCPLFYAFAP